MPGLLKKFDITVTNAVVSLPSSWTHFFTSITNLGDPIITVSIGVVAMGYGWITSNMRLAVAGGIAPATLVVGSCVKMIIARERPLTGYAANMRIDTFSFPSGHTSGATIAYGLLAYLVLQYLPAPFSYIAAGLFIGLIVIIGISRVYLGAHFPSDVIAGWLLGLAALGIIIFVVRPVL